MRQAKHTMSGQTVYRWQLATDRGIKYTWAPTREEAKSKAETKGLIVRETKPAKPVGI